MKVCLWSLRVLTKPPVCPKQWFILVDIINPPSHLWSDSWCYICHHVVLYYCIRELRRKKPLLQPQEWRHHWWRSLLQESSLLFCNILTFQCLRAVEINNHIKCIKEGTDIRHFLSHSCKRFQVWANCSQYYVPTHVTYIIGSTNKGLDGL